jgi:membrane protein CcdC involved in cytochrome C biogenesis
VKIELNKILLIKFVMKINVDYKFIILNMIMIIVILNKIFKLNINNHMKKGMIYFLVYSLIIQLKILYIKFYNKFINNRFKY